MNLQELREAQGISRSRFAVWIDCSDADLERYEDGEQTLSEQQMAEAIAILGEFDSPQPGPSSTESGT